ncbi:hypothetical protein LINPERHAP1_LOCUS35632 [Linum perenne]
MGCTTSVYAIGKKKNKLVISEAVIHVPAIRIPALSDLHRPLRGLVPRDLLDRLAGLRSQIVFIADDTGGSAIPDLKGTLEDYLSVLLGLTKKEHGLEDLVEFKWKSLENGRQETGLANCWFEVLSVVHLMAMLTLSEANSLMIPKAYSGSGIRVVSSDCKREAIDLLLKASGYLEFCIHEVLTHIPPEIKENFPKDLQDGVLDAISIQALGQAYQSLLGADMSNGYGKKQLSFIKWKFLESKAAAYYYHGLVVDKGSEQSCHVSAVCCFVAAQGLLTESKRACLSFCLSPPITRSSPPWGVMKHLHQKIPEVATRKSEMYGYLMDEEKALQVLPELPDFQLSLSPDDYALPEADPAWDINNWEIQKLPLKDHLQDSEGEEN